MSKGRNKRPLKVMRMATKSPYNFRKAKMRRKMERRSQRVNRQ